MRRALATRRFGPYTLQAAIAAVHAEAPTPAATDWPADRRPLRRAAADRALAGRRAEPGRRGRHARRSRKPASRSSTRSWRAATWPTITSPMRPAPTCAAGWAERPTPAPPTSGRWPWPDRNPNAGSSRNACGNWVKKNLVAMSIRARPVRLLVRQGNRRPRLHRRNP